MEETDKKQKKKKKLTQLYSLFHKIVIYTKANVCLTTALKKMDFGMGCFGNSIALSAYKISEVNYMAFFIHYYVFL